MRPVPVLVGAPSSIVVVLRNRILNLIIIDSFQNVFIFFLKFKFGRVNTDNHKPFIPVFCIPVFQIRQSSYAVYAGVSPEINEHNVALFAKLTFGFCISTNIIAAATKTMTTKATKGFFMKFILNLKVMLGRK